MDTLITIDEVKRQCYLDVTDLDEDCYLKSLIDAAIDFIELKISRKLYPIGGVPDEDVTGKEVNGAIKSAALMLIGYYYENRELHLSMDQKRAFEFLLRDFREPQEI